MKKLIIMLFAVLLLAACGDKTTINGYTDEQVEKLLEANKDTVYQVTDGDSVLTYIYVTDTLYNEIVDTVYKMSVDTLYKTLYDTLSTTIIDTVVNTLVDTIVTRVIDTVINTMVDTIYTRVVDTVFSVLEDVGVNTELPRDTTITLTDTIDGSVISKTYVGKVYHNVFYETKLYQYADTERTKNTYYPLGTSYSVGSIYDNNIYDLYTLVNQCGGVVAPSDGLYHLTLSKSASRTVTMQYKTIAGWRIMDDTDGYILRNVLDSFIPDSATVYLSTISYQAYGRLMEEGYKTLQANVATSHGITVMNNPKHYMCAYDLK